MGLSAFGVAFYRLITCFAIPRDLREQIQGVNAMIFDMPDCGGCKTCEMACGYHHSGVFQPAISSLRVLAAEEGVGYRIMLIEHDSETAAACDGCKDLDGPLCVGFCEKEEELRRILDDFLEKRSKTSRKKG